MDYVVINFFLQTYNVEFYTDSNDTLSHADTLVHLVSRAFFVERMKGSQ